MYDPQTDRLAAVAGTSGLASGSGHIEVCRVGGRSRCTRAQATAPLELLTPQRRSPAAWVYARHAGGGLVAGEHLHLYLDVHANSTAVLTTPTPTKVFHRHAATGAGAEQTLQAAVAPGATLVVAPEPVACHADAAYRQRQTFDLVGDASLVLLNWVACRRTERGERWTFARYDSRNRVRRDGEEIAIDRLRLDAARHPPADAFAAGPFDVLATLLFVGPAARPGVEAAARWIAGLDAAGTGNLQASLSPRPWGGVLRVMGVRSQKVVGLLKQRLDFLTPALGAGVWSRRV